MDHSAIQEFTYISSKLEILSFACDLTFSKWFSLSKPLLKLLCLDEKDILSDPELWTSRIPMENREFIQERLNELDIPLGKNSIEIDVLSCDESTVRLFLTFCQIKKNAEKSYYICSAENISKEEKYKKEAIKSRDYEIEISARIQKSLLTGTYTGKSDYLEISADTLPSKQVDGDFYEFISLSDTSLDFIIGDVMGKGVPAALLAAAAKTAFFKAIINLAVLENRVPDIKGILNRINGEIASELVNLNKFLTLYYCRIDMFLSTLYFIDAGHTNIIYYSMEDNLCWTIKGSNMPLGFTEQQDFRTYQLPIRTGDLLFFYSDGITEVENSENIQFGDERLKQLVFAHRHLDPEKLIQKVLNVTFFYASENFNDDVTVIAAKVKKHSRSLFKREIAKTDNPDAINLEEIRKLLYDDTLNVFADIESEEVSKILIAYIEALTNCIKFSRGPLSTGWDISERRFLLSIDFYGPDFEWASWNNPDLASYQQSGFGLYLINQVMDSFLLLKGSGGRKKILMIKELKWS